MSRMHFFSQRGSKLSARDDNPQAKLQALEELLENMSEVGGSVSGDVRLLIESQGQSGPMNMAIDEALLESVAAGNVATFRVYSWSEATVSLGYFQRETSEIEPEGRFHGLAAVRRLSGGGAILHHREVTYSCCIPGTHPLAQEPSHLYDEIHRCIRDTLKSFNAEVEPRGENEGDDKPFLCYARGDRRDLVYRGFKIVGSAQRRRHSAILQHGSILLRRSPFLLEFPGICDLARVDIPEFTLKQRLAHAVSSVLGEHPEIGALSNAERVMADHLEREKYRALMPQIETGSWTEF
ncbi:MAG: biotin/lipoate A/B protein ligase family protein [Planctomycetaceae bacterium]